MLLRILSSRWRSRVFHGQFETDAGAITASQKVEAQAVAIWDQIIIATPKDASAFNDEDSRGTTRILSTIGVGLKALMFQLERDAAIAMQESQRTD
jgi:hypothetical protein